ncbi:MAG: DUF5658 family protein [Sporosarcina sp.]
MDVKLPILNRHKLFASAVTLLLLAAADSFFTDFGIQQRYITEANPLMRFVYDRSVFGFYAIKICLPFVLLILLAKIETKRYLQILMGFSLLLYSIVLFQHVLWISLVL